MADGAGEWVAPGVARSPRMVVDAGGVGICVQTFGDDADPAVVLVGGAGAPMDWWRDAFCAAIARGGRRVVRYDLRDTGQSVSSPAGRPGYDGADLAADVIGVLDALGIARAHLAGVSMGGGIVQRVAVEHPGRVASITLISTSPVGPGGPDDPDLPPPSPALQEAFAEGAPSPDWGDREAVIGSFLDGERMFAGRLGVDEEEVRALAGVVFDRTADVAASMTNHGLLEDGPPLRGGIEGITAPALVVHGRDDPLFPPGHGEALARRIPGARLLLLDGMGHEVPPPPVWDVVVPAILEHTAAR